MSPDCFVTDVPDTTVGAQIAEPKEHFMQDPLSPLLALKSGQRPSQLVLIAPICSIGNVVSHRKR